MTREANPFAERTVYITETQPLDAEVPLDVQAISIIPDRTDIKAKPKPNEIETVLAGLPANRIELFEVDYNASLEGLPDLSRFPNLRFIHIGGRKVREIGDLSIFRKIENLYVANLKTDRLSVLKLHCLKNLRLIRGNVEAADIPVSDWALLQNCSRLNRLGPVEIRHLTLESCRGVNLNALAEISGLRVLDLHSHGKIEDVDFLEQCNQLTSLTVTATSLSSARLSGFGRCPSLKRVFLAIGKPRLKALAAEYPGIVFGNGEVSFRGAEMLPGAAWYDMSLTQ